MIMGLLLQIPEKNSSGFQFVYRTEYSSEMGVFPNSVRFFSSSAASVFAGCLVDNFVARRQNHLAIFRA